MMKKLFYIMFVAALLPVFNACSDEDNPNTPPPSKGEETVKKIVEVLEDTPEVSEFVELLKKVDVTNLTEDKLTAFAVKNQTIASARGDAADSVLNESSIKRHIAKGSYSKDQLVDGMRLTSISEDTLYITRTGDNVFVNGVIIEGEAIPAGNSYIYVIPEVIQIQEVPVSPTYKHQTTLSVKEILVTDTIASTSSLADVTVIAKDGNSGLELGTFKTDKEGNVTIMHNCDSLIYRLEKNEYTDLVDGGYLFTFDEEAGIPMLIDMNGDGMINNNDKVANPEWPYLITYQSEETNTERIHYMISSQESPAMSPSEIQKDWSALNNSYKEMIYELEQKLTQGKDSFNYATDFIFESQIYYSYTSKIIHTGEYYIKELKAIYQDGYAESVAQSITLDILRMRTDMYGYYGQVFDGGENQLIIELNQIIENYPESHANIARYLMAKTYMISGNYVQYSFAEDALNRGLSEMEAAIIAAIGNKEQGYSDKALEWINLVRTHLAMAPTDTISNGMIIDLCKSLSIPAYLYYRILNEPILGKGFRDINYLFPVPEEVFAQYPDTKQNPGY